MRKIASFVEPKLAKYLVKEKPVSKPKLKPVERKYVPRDLKDFVELIQRTPKSIITNRDRRRIAAVMSFDEQKVKDLMVSREKMVFVKKNEVLGPLVLDRLYKSGFTNFPVVNETGKVVGLIHTEALNALRIRKADNAGKYINKEVNYLTTDDNLKRVVEEMERTNSCYFLVNDKNGVLVGCFSLRMLMDYLMGIDE